MLRVEVTSEPVGGCNRKHWQEKGLKFKGRHEVKTDKHSGLLKSAVYWSSHSCLWPTLPPTGSSHVDPELSTTCIKPQPRRRMRCLFQKERNWLLTRQLLKHICGSRVVKCEEKALLGNCIVATSWRVCLHRPTQDRYSLAEDSGARSEDEAWVWRLVCGRTGLAITLPPALYIRRRKSALGGERPQDRTSFSVRDSSLWGESQDDGRRTF